MLDNPYLVVALVMGVFLIFFFLKRFIQLGKFERIEKMIHAKHFQKAIPLLKAMNAKNDDNILSHYYLGLCYFNLQNFEWAMPEFKKVIRHPRLGKEVDELEVREKLANIYLHYNQLEEAQKEFLLMAQLDPKNYKNYFEIGMILYKQGYLDPAYTYFQKALERNPKFPDAYYHVGLITYDKKRFNESLSFFSDAVKYDSTLYKARYYMGMIYFANKSYEKALGEFALSERDSDMRQKTILQKGKIYMELGNLDRAVFLFSGYLKSLTSENNVTLSMRYNLATIYESRRNILGAIEQWERINKFKPNYMDVQDKLAEYENLRMDDRIKDFMVASRDSYQVICRNVIEYWKYQILREEYIDDERMEFLTVEPGSKWRNTRKIRVYIVIMRRNNKLEERELALILDTMKLNNAIKGICVCIAGFTESAKAYSQSRPIDLYDKEEFSQILSKAEEFSKERLKNNLKGIQE